MLPRIVYVIGRRSLRIRSRKLRSISSKVLPHIVNFSSINDLSLINLEKIVESAIKVEIATLALETSLIFFSLNSKKNAKTSSTNPKRFMDKTKRTQHTFGVFRPKKN
jgi:hypothetical protein